ncbi:glycosyltransferase family 76 protein [Atractiella rhizophila]|nr:glycosyltransferase family 76 protein [Atractiella rhizophila]
MHKTDVRMTLALFRSTSMARDLEKFAFTAACLHACLAPSPPVTIVPYSESFFCLFTFAGILCHCKCPPGFSAKVFFTGLLSAVSFSLATLFRPNAILTGGGLWLWRAWIVLIQPDVTMKAKSLHLGVFLTFAVIAVAPFAQQQYRAFRLFCAATTQRSWCNAVLPSVYSFVQSQYWNVGFLRYWEFAQLPNFLISLPVLLTAMYFVRVFFRRFGFIRMMRHVIRTTTAASDSPSLEQTLFPLVLVNILYLFILIFASHIQICIRQSLTIPLYWWGVAVILSEHANVYCVWWKRLMLSWNILWPIFSIFLWTGFYPPA